MPTPPEASVPPPHAVTLARKKKAKQRLVAIAIFLAIAIGALWYFQKSLSLPLREIATFGTSVGTSVSGQIDQKFSAPSPLQQVTKAAPKKTNALTVEGVIAQTNDQRAQNNEDGGLLPLTENATLDAVATLRIDDMFAQQYFAHVGPQGESAVTVASSVGYTNLAFGENLALGLYAGDAGVVTAWMNSPGHRANILDTHYTQIGVAVREGMFQGQNTWIAVQIFGRPASDCPAPDANIKTNIDLSENQISAMETELASDKAAIAAMSPQSGPQYNQQVEDYNNLVAQYNNLAAGTKTAIAEYDAEVDAFNACLGE
jgi:uncharacterized protein YkwD